MMTRSADRLLHAPVFMRAQQLPDDFDIVAFIDERKHDGQVAGNSVGPQS